MPSLGAWKARRWAGDHSLFAFCAAGGCGCSATSRASVQVVERLPPDATFSVANQRRGEAATIHLRFVPDQQCRHGSGLASQGQHLAGSASSIPPGLPSRGPVFDILLQAALRHKRQRRIGAPRPDAPSRAIRTHCHQRPSRTVLLGCGGHDAAGRWARAVPGRKRKDAAGQSSPWRLPGLVSACRGVAV